MGCASSVQVTNRFNEFDKRVLSLHARIESIEKSTDTNRATVAKLDVDVGVLRKDFQEATREEDLDVEILSQCSDVTASSEEVELPCDRRLGFNMW